MQKYKFVERKIEFGVHCTNYQIFGKFGTRPVEHRHLLCTLA